jgi:nitrile hydratase accessory protein
MTRLTTPVPGTIASLPLLRRDDDGPVFAEPWQAQAFALAVKLSEQGHFTWNEWAAALADELQGAVRRGEPDDGSRYYEHWLAALEKLVAEKGLTDSAALLTRKQAWVSAYRSTPHGQPVELPSASGISEFLVLLVGCGVVAALYWFMRGENGSALREGARVGAVVSAGFGALLGMRHAFEPDHLAAISTLMTGNRSSAHAAWLGACWGIGHTLTLLVAGGLLMVLKLEMPGVVAQVFELAVIVMLMGFGVRAMHQGIRRRSTRPTHTHGTSGSLAFSGMDHWTIARPLLVGAVHGLAGSGTLTALVVTTLPSTTTRLTYLTLFGVGTTVGMVVLSGLLGWTIAKAGSDRFVARTLSVAAGALSIGLGFAWAVPVVEALF